MTDPRPMLSPEFDARLSQRRALTALLVLLVFHVWATWGYVGSLYGEIASWMHEVDRFAHGEAVYRDFTFPYPPLSIWVVGGLAKVLGTSVTALSIVTAAIAVALFLVFQQLVAKVAPGVGAAAVVTGVVFATAYAARFGPPLTTGGIVPAGPLGMLCLLAGVILVIRLGDRGELRSAAGAAGALGLSTLCRHDFWFPAIFLVVWGVLAVRHAEGRVRLRGVLVGGFVATFLAGIVIALVTSGPAALSFVVPQRVGYGLLGTLPSLERLVMEVAAASALGIAGVVALWLCFTLEDGRAFRMAAVLLVIFLSACAVHLGMSVATAQAVADHGVGQNPTLLEETIGQLAGTQSPLRTALFLLDQRFQTHLFPAVMPPVLLAVLVLRWRRWGLRRDRDLTLLMLGLALTLRARRGFAGADWPNVLVEIPAYALFLHLVAAAVGRSAQRAVSMALTILFVVGLYTYYNLGVGPLTKRRYAATVTAHGTVRWEPWVIAEYRGWAAALDSLDPGRQRPLLTFGPSGGWNYFFARSNPTRFTRGFTSAEDAETVRAALRDAPHPALIVDTRTVVRIARPATVTIGWEPRFATPPVTLAQLPALEPLLEGCRRREGIPSEPTIPIYDCGATPAPTPPDTSR